VRFPGIDGRYLDKNQQEMFLRISQFADCPKEDNSSLCTRVHDAGQLPNTMNRFMQSNWHEVLFVN
jgi:hypothetical protein